MAYRILHTYKWYWPDTVGGVARVIAMLAKSGAPRFDHSILVSRQAGFTRRSDDCGVPVLAHWSFGTISSTPLSPTFSLALLREARHADLVVHHAPFPLVDLALLLPFPRHVPVIVHWHADLVRPPLTLGLVHPLMRRTLQMANRIIVSHQSIIDHSALLQPHSHKCAIVPYAVDADFWGQLNEQEAKKVEQLRSAFPRLIVSIGRLVPYKGFDALLRAMQKLDATLVIIGSGPLHGQLQRLAHELGVHERISLPGQLDRSELKVFLHAARVFAFPSVSPAESFGLAQLEAMATGLPVVNTRLASAVPHVARDGIEAITVPPGDADAMAREIGRLLDDETMRQQLGRAGKLRVQDFSRSLFAETMGLHYEEAIKEHRTQDSLRHASTGSQS